MTQPSAVKERRERYVEVLRAIENLNEFTTKEVQSHCLAVEGIEPAQFFYALADLNALAPSRVDLKPLESLEVHFKQRVLSTGEVLV